MKKICCLAWMVVLLGVLSAQSALCAINKIEDLKHKGGKLGAYKAIIIGVDRYQDSKIPELNGVAKCAKTLAKTLKGQYGFSTELLINKNATKDNLLKKIEGLTSSVKKSGMVLIYFIGRGEVDSSGSKSWWYPVDAKSGDYSSYVDCTKIQNAVRNMKAKDVLLIADSGYADAFFGSVHKLPAETDDAYYMRLYNKKSRWAITSGNDYPDKGKGGGCSTFTGEIITVLKTNEQPHLSVQQLFKKIKKTVRKNSFRPPRCRSLKNTDDRGGEFIFVLKTPPAKKVEKAAADTGKKKVKKAAPTPEKRIGESSLVLKSNVKGAEVVMDGVAIGTTPLKKHVVPPGSHKLEVTKEGYLPFKKNVLVKRGVVVSLTATLEKKKVVKTTGTLVLKVKPPGATVKFVGKDLKYTPGMALEKGKYQIEFSYKYYEKQVKDIDIIATKESSVAVELKPVKTIKLKSVGDFTVINPGSFMMGSLESGNIRTADENQHKVSISKRIYMQTKEVTVGQWRRFAKATKYKTEAEATKGAFILVDYNWEQDSEYCWGITGFTQTNDHPVVAVSWNDIQAYVKWLNKKSRGKLKFRLPTEAEWEYSCRAGTKTNFSFGECLSREEANFEGNSKWNTCSVGKSSTGTDKVGSYPPNAWGLYDMHGNAKEWCQDWYGSYAKEEVSDPQGPGSGSSKVVRGGGWTDFVNNTRSAKRMKKKSSDSFSDTGFRLVIELP